MSADYDPLPAPDDRGVVVMHDDWRGTAREIAAAEGLPVVELLRRRASANHEVSALRRDLKRFSRLLQERVAKPGSAWLDAAEVAQLLRMTVRAVYVDMQRRPTGELARACTRVGRRLRFSREGIDAMLRQSLRSTARAVLIRPSPVPSARKETGR